MLLAPQSAQYETQDNLYRHFSGLRRCLRAAKCLARAKSALYRDYEFARSSNAFAAEYRYLRIERRFPCINRRWHYLENFQTSARLYAKFPCAVVFRSAQRNDLWRHGYDFPDDRWRRVMERCFARHSAQIQKHCDDKQ